MPADSGYPSIDMPAEGKELEGEFPDKFYCLGGAAQTPWSDGVVGWGWEGGGYANWIVDDVSVFVLSSGGTTARYQDSRLNVGDSIGTVEFEGTMLMMSLGGRL